MTSHAVSFVDGSSCGCFSVETELAFPQTAVDVLAGADAGDGVVGKVARRHAARTGPKPVIMKAEIEVVENKALTMCRKVGSE